MQLRPSRLSSPPQLGISTGNPNPRKLSDASAMMTPPISGRSVGTLKALAFPHPFRYFSIYYSILEVFLKLEDSMDKKSSVPIQQHIHLIRGKEVIIDSDLAELYGVPTKRLNEQVKRNIERFPEDFMFQMTKEELDPSRKGFRK